MSERLKRFLNSLPSYSFGDTAHIYDYREDEREKIMTKAHNSKSEVSEVEKLRLISDWLLANCPKQYTDRSTLVRIGDAHELLDLLYDLECSTKNAEGGTDE